MFVEEDCCYFLYRRDVNDAHHVAIINLLQGWEMLSDNDMCSFPGSQESWHGDICQHGAQTFIGLTSEMIITFYSCVISVLCRVLLVFSIPSTLSSLTLLSSALASHHLIECVPRQTESDDSGHLEWHSPSPHDGLTRPQATSHVMTTSWQSPANTFFTLWHLQSSSDFCSQLSYIACKVCYELREKKMRPDKVKTITGVMKPLLGRGDNERIFSRNLVSINHVDHRTALMFCSTLYRLILHVSGQPWPWLSPLWSVWSLQWNVWPGVLCWSWRSNQSNVTLPTQVKIPGPRP